MVTVNQHDTAGRNELPRISSVSGSEATMIARRDSRASTMRHWWSSHTYSLPVWKYKLGGSDSPLPYRGLPTVTHRQV